MIVILFERRFWKPIATGEKVHTIRRTRKRAITPGDRLSLRGWEDRPYRSRQRVLCEETCLTVSSIWIDGHGLWIDSYGGRIGKPEQLEEFARSDGFESWAELLAYHDLHYGLPFSGDFIQWGEHLFLKRLFAERS